MSPTSSRGSTCVANPAPNWRIVKIDLRSPVGDAWPIARVELEHPERGRVTDIGSAPGAFDAAFTAAGHILGIAPRIIGYQARSTAPSDGGALGMQIDIELEIDGKVYRGASSGVDLVICSMTAWLNAANQSPPGTGTR